MASCTVKGCRRAHVARGLCKLHYYRVRRNGSVNLPQPELPADATEADVAWAAGFIDADGSILIGVSKRKGRADAFSPTVTASGVDLEPLETLRLLFGGHIIAQRHISGTNRLPFFAWRVTDFRAIWCARLLMPYLRIKSMQAYLLSCFDLETLWSKGGSSSLMPETERTRRIELVEEVRYWNGRSYIKEKTRLADFGICAAIGT